MSVPEVKSEERLMLEARARVAVDHDERFHILESRMTAVEDAVRDNATQVGGDVKELLELFKAAKGGLKVLGWFGVAVKWVAGVAAAFAPLYAIFQNFKGH